MPHARPFEQWFGQVRAGDPAATAEFVRAYAPSVRKAVRARVARLRLGHLVDPADVSQTVLVGFFARLASGWPGDEVNSPERLTALLLAIARNKFRDEVRRHTAGRRDHRRLSQSRSVDPLANAVSTAPSPGAVVAGQELRDLALTLLSSEELSLLEERMSGADWAAIAADRGVPAGVLRQKLSRAVRRVRQRLSSH